MHARLRSYPFPRFAAGVALVLASMLGLAAGVVPAADAATVPGWRIVTTFGPPGGGSQVMSVAAVSATDAWLAGGTCANPCGSIAFIFRHWNGRSWHQLPAPSGVFSPSAALSSAVVGASPGASAWAFAGISATNDYTVALHWTGARWARYRFPDWSAINAAAVFSRTNAWAFGEKIIPKFRPYVARYNGSRWRTVSVPVLPQDASALSAGNIWAVGPTTRSLAKPFRSRLYALMHWTGRAWRTIGFPKLRLPVGATVAGTHLVALSSRDVWADALLGKGEGAYPGAVLLHWNGKRWNRVRVPYATFSLTSLTQDGHGGLWISATNASGAVAYLYHYRGGHWARQRVPSEGHGSSSQLNALSWSRGANFGWAGGLTLPGDGSSQGILLKYVR